MAQAIMSPVGITTHGSALVRAEPDFAYLSITTGFMDPSSATALLWAREGLAKVRAALNEANVPEHDVLVGTVSIHRSTNPRREYRDEYSSSVRLEVTLRDLATIDPVVVAVTDTEAVSDLHLAFHSSELRELRATARTLAVGAARAKAERYATAADVTLGRVVHLEDLNPDAVPNYGHNPDLDLTPALEFDPTPNPMPGSLVVRAAVMIAYAIDQ